MNDEHPWQSAVNEFQNIILPWLLEHGKTIGTHSSGTPLAQKIISYYSLLHKSFDPMTFTLLKDSIEEYKKIKI